MLITLGLKANQASVAASSARNSSCQNRPPGNLHNLNAALLAVMLGRTGFGKRAKRDLPAESSKTFWRLVSRQPD